MAKRRETSLNYSTINDKNKLETITKKLLMYVLFLCLHMLHIRRNNNNTNILQIAATAMATKQNMRAANNKVKQTSNHPTDRPTTQQPICQSAN